jgi:fructose-1,6-bisphosphatase-3
MYLQRSDCLIFHGCVPVNENGSFRGLEINGKTVAGKEMFEEIELVVRRALEKSQVRDLDLLWYLWCGPISPLFGKDRIATFERDFITNKESHRENKDPYFDLIHQEEFCEKVLREFRANPNVGLIVNGHVPVKLTKGESPMKKSGKAITIDGGFSEAYGDHGYTLVLEPDKIVLAEHHHFESVESAIQEGIDIVPKTEIIRSFKKTQSTADTERGQRIHYRIQELKRLIQAYKGNRLYER